MSLFPLAEKFFQTPFNGIIRIELAEGSGSLWVDGRQSPPQVTEKAPPNVGEAFCLWRTNKETLNRILSPGVRQLEAAYIAGRLNISGDMSVMARLEVGATL